MQRKAKSPQEIPNSSCKREDVSLDVAIPSLHGGCKVEELFPILKYPWQELGKNSERQKIQSSVETNCTASFIWISHLMIVNSCFEKTLY